MRSFSKIKPILYSLPQWLRTHPALAAGLAVAFVLGVWLLTRSTAQQEGGGYHTVKRGNFLVSIVEGGSLEAVNEIVVRNEVDGTARIIYIVPEGTYVKKGDVIVELDSAEAEEALKDQKITFETSRAAYIMADNNLEIMKSTVDSEIRAAELALTLAKMDLEKFEELDRDQQLRNAALLIDTSEEALKLAEQTFDTSKKLAAEGFETKSTVDKDSLAVSRNFKEREKALSDFKMLKDYELTKMEAEFRSFHEEAQRELDRVKKQGESKIAQAQADKNSAEATLELNEDKLTNMQEQLKHSKILAPQDGLAVYAISESRYSQETMIEEGAQVRKRQELIKIPDTSKMKVGLKVHESHIGHVTVGQPAFVVLDSLPDRTFRGEVTKVSILPDAQSRWGNPDMKVYGTEVVISDKLPDIKPGVSARAEIVVANLQNVLTVPIQAVTTVKGEQVCYVKRLGGTESVTVVVGMFNSSHIEIKSGLEEADEVMLAPPVSEEIDLDGGVLEETEGLDLPTERPEETSSKRGGEGDAERDQQDGKEDGAEGEAGAGDRRSQMLERFDTDGDGQLSESERQAMRNAFGDRGRGGDGDDGERRGGGGRGRGGRD